jgi:hypothetical protein
MSRQSPLGFAASMAIEVAAVVFVVSLLPRVDLRPKAQAASGNSVDLPETEFVNATPMPRRETSYYQDRATSPAGNSSVESPLTWRAPPLLASTEPEPRYVEQRLDRASQQLVNGVGSYVAQAAGDFLGSSSPVASDRAPLLRGSFPTETSARSPHVPQTRSSHLPVQTPQAPTQPRPWIRY